MTKRKSRLHFEELAEKMPSKLIHEAAKQDDEDNSAVTAADRAVSAGSLSHDLSRKMQKTSIKQEYAKAKRASERTATASEVASKAASAAADKAKRAVEFIKSHKKLVLIVLIIFAVLMLFMAMISSCTAMFQGVIGGISALTTYQSREEDMLEVEAAYRELEAELQEKLDNYAAMYPDYDEYRISGTVDGHDPYVLTSMLSVMYGKYDLAEVQGELDSIFDLQYQLVESTITETRYRREERTDFYIVEDPDTGELYEVPYTYEVDVPYDYTIRTVTLTQVSMDELPADLLDDDQREHYDVYMDTKGNYPDLFSGTAVTLRAASSSAAFRAAPPTDPDTFSLMKAEAEKYLGYEYRWGGSNPATSFDCSGYVSWVANHSGWDIGRRTAKGLYNLCTPVSAEEVQPGDLVFFVGTFDTIGVSHVGIYAGNDEMLHAGNPISYADLTLPYWRERFFAYGRLPEQEVQ